MLPLCIPGTIRIALRDICHQASSARRLRISTVPNQKGTGNNFGCFPSQSHRATSLLVDRDAGIDLFKKRSGESMLRHYSVRHEGGNSRLFVTIKGCNMRYWQARKSKPFLSKPIVNLDNNQALRSVPMQQSINHLIDGSGKLDCVGRSRLDAHEAEYIPDSATSFETSSAKKT